MPEPDQQIVDNPAATTQNWRDSVLEEYRSGVAKFGTANDLAKGYVELEKSTGGKVKLPTEESTPEEKSSFYTKLGRPDTSDGYNRPDLPDGKTYDEALVGGMQTAAFEEGLTSSQFTKLVERYLAIETQQAESSEAERVRVQEETDRALKEQWGGEYDKNIEVSRRALKELVPGELGEQFSALIEESGLGDNLVFIQGFQAIGSKTLDDTLVKSDSAPAVEKDYTPSHPNSPEMYKNSETDEGKKARAYFEKRGYTY